VAVHQAEAEGAGQGCGAGDVDLVIPGAGARATDLDGQAAVRRLGVTAADCQRSRSRADVHLSRIGEVAVDSSRSRKNAAVDVDRSARGTQCAGNEVRGTSRLRVTVRPQCEGASTADG